MNKLINELISIFLIVAAVVIFRSSFLNWYVIPTGSLLPTLNIGDHIVVNKLSYGFMPPFMENRIYSWDEPKRGDVVVFQGPESEGHLTLIKRVAGIGGDQVTFTNGVLTINGVTAKETLQTDRTPLKNMGGDDDQDNVELYQEFGFSQQPHYILKKKQGSFTNQETRVWQVPAHKLLLLGDNRDNSADSRFWGFMDENRIYGRAFMISFSTYTKPGSIIPRFRGDRWFKKITN